MSRGWIAGVLVFLVAAGVALARRCDRPSIACNLRAFTAEERVAHEALTRKLRGAVVKTTELADGFALRIPVERMSAAELRGWVAEERRCCPFLRMSVDDAGGALELRLEGGDGVKDFLRAEFAG